jgi:hypothetical protein
VPIQINSKVKLRLVLSAKWLEETVLAREEAPIASTTAGKVIAPPRGGNPVVA